MHKERERREIENEAKRAQNDIRGEEGVSRRADGCTRVPASDTCGVVLHDACEEARQVWDDADQVGRVNKMTDAEKVLQGLTCCTNGQNVVPKCEMCPYADETGVCAKLDEMHRDAKKLIQDLTPRVLTLDEVLHSPDRLMWLQYKSANSEDGYELHPTAPYGDDSQDGFGVSFQSGHVQTRGLYGKQWRCWTEKPTREEAVNWDE